MSYSQSCYISITQILGLQEWPENTRNEWDEEQGKAKLSGSKKAAQHVNSQVNRTTKHCTVFKISCLSLKPDWCPPLPWSACYSHTAILPTNKGGLSHASIVQIYLKKTYITGSTAHLHLSAWLDALLLFFYLKFIISFFHPFFLSSLLTSTTPDSLVSEPIPPSCFQMAESSDIPIILTAVCGNAELTCASLLTSPGCLLHCLGDSPM